MRWKRIPLQRCRKIPATENKGGCQHAPHPDQDQQQVGRKWAEALGYSFMILQQQACKYLRITVNIDHEPARVVGCEDREIQKPVQGFMGQAGNPEDHCLLYTSPSPRDRTRSRMPSSA